MVEQLAEQLVRANNVAELIFALHHFCATCRLTKDEATSQAPNPHRFYADAKARWRDWLFDAFSNPQALQNLFLQNVRGSFDDFCAAQGSLDEAQSYLWATAGLVNLDNHFNNQERLFWNLLDDEVSPGDVLPVHRNVFVQRFLIARDQQEHEPAKAQYRDLSTRAAASEHGYPGSLDNFVVVTEHLLDNFEVELVDTPQLYTRFEDFICPEEGGEFVMAAASVLPRATWTPDASAPSDLAITPDEDALTFWVKGYHPDREEDVVEEILAVVRGLDEEGVQLLVLPELTVFEPAIDAIADFLCEDAQHLRLVVAGSRHTHRDDGQPVNRTCLLYGLDEDNEADALTGTELVAARHEKFRAFKYGKLAEDIVTAPAKLQLLRLPIGTLSLLICADVLNQHAMNRIRQLGTTLYCVPSMTEVAAAFDNKFGELSHYHQPIIIWANCCGVQQDKGQDFRPRENVNGIRMPVERNLWRWLPQGCIDCVMEPCPMRCGAQVVRVRPDATFERKHWP